MDNIFYKKYKRIQYSIKKFFKKNQDMKQAKIESIVMP